MFEQIGYIICVPFAALTRLFYTWTGSYGVAIILFTLVVKLVMLPFQLKSKKSMLRMGRMSGRIKDIQTRYANNKEKQQQEIAELYAREGVNPMSGCLWSFIPFPILIALYNIIRYPLRYFMMLSNETIEEITKLAVSLGYTAPEGGTQAAYSQINLAEFIHRNWASFEGKFDGLLDMQYNFIGLDLSQIAGNVFSQFPGGGWAVWGLLLLPIISAGIQILMTQISMRSSGTEMAGGSRMMLWLMPLMTLWIGYSLPSALCVYWIAQSAFSLLQEITLNKYFNKILDREETDKEREKREKRIAKYEKQKALLEQQRGASNSGSKPAEKRKPQKTGEKKQAGTNENGRVGNRPYARGRAFSEDHYGE